MSTLQNLFENSLVSTRRGDSAALKGFEDFIGNDDTLKTEFLTLLKEHYWNKASQALTSDHASPYSKGEVLSVVLAIDSLWCDVLLLLIECIALGEFSNHQIGECISLTCNKLVSLCSDIMPEKKLRETILFLQQLPNTCLNAALKSKHPLSSNVTDLLELISPSLDTLVLLCRRKQVVGFKWSQSVQFVLQCIMDVSWTQHCALFLNILCDMHHHFNDSDIKTIQRKVLATASILKESDRAIVILACLRHFKLSSDPTWIHVIRQVYKDIPQSSEQTVEPVLEEALSSNARHDSVMTCLMVIQVIEDTAASSLLSCIRGSAEEYDVIGPSDMRLVLLLLRACRGGFGSGDVNSNASIESLAINLSETTNSSDHDIILFITQACRTFFFLWLCLGYIRAKDKSSFGMVQIPSLFISSNIYRMIFLLLGTESGSAETKYSSNESFLHSNMEQSVLSNAASSSSFDINKKWISANRAADIFFMCGVCAHNPVDTIMSSVQFIADSQLKFLTLKRTFHLKTNSDPFVQLSQGVIYDHSVRFISDCISSVFSAVEASRVSIFVLVLRRIIGERNLTQELVNSKPAEGLDASRSCRAIMMQSLVTMCLRHGDQVEQLSNHILNFVPMLTILPLVELEAVSSPLLSMVISSTLALSDPKTNPRSRHLSDLSSALLIMFRKSAMSSDPGLSLFGLVSLLRMLPILTPSNQLEICQHVVFPKADKMDVAETDENVLLLPGHRFTAELITAVVRLLYSNKVSNPLHDGAYEAENLELDFIECDKGLSRSCLYFLRFVLLQHVLKLFVIVDDAQGEIFSALDHSNITGSIDDTINVYGHVLFAPGLCCDTVSKINATENNTTSTKHRFKEVHELRTLSYNIKDDIYLLLKAAWSCEIYMDPVSAMQQLEWLSYRLLRGPSSRDDEYCEQSKLQKEPHVSMCIWSGIIFKGIVNLLESGLVLYKQRSDSQYFPSDRSLKYKSELSLLCDLHSIEHIVCLYGVVSGVMHCLASAVNDVEGHCQTASGKKLFHACIFSLQTVLDFLTNITEWSGDMNGFHFNSCELLSETNTCPSVLRYHPTAEKPLFHYGDRTCNDMNDSFFKSRWGSYFSANFPLSSIVDVLSSQLSLFNSLAGIGELISAGAVESSETPDLVEFSLGVVLSSIRISCHELSEYIKSQKFDASKEKIEQLNGAASIFRILIAIYIKLGCAEMESVILSRAMRYFGFVMSRMGTEMMYDEKFRKSTKQVGSWNKGTNDSKRKRSIYTEYSDLSDFDEADDNEEQDNKSSLDSAMNTNAIGPDVGKRSVEQNFDLATNHLLQEIKAIDHTTLDVLFACPESLFDGDIVELDDTTRVLSSLILQIMRAYPKLLSNSHRIDVAVWKKGGKYLMRKILHPDIYKTSIRNLLFSVRYELLVAVTSAGIVFLDLLKRSFGVILDSNDDRGLISKVEIIERSICFFCDDLAASVANGLTFRLLQAYMDTIKTLLDIRHLLSIRSSYWLRIVKENLNPANDSLLQVVCACKQLTSRMLSRMCLLILERCASVNDSLVQCLKLLMLSSRLALVNHSGRVLALPEDINASNLDIIQQEIFKFTSLVVSSNYPSEIEFNDNVEQITCSVASVLFLPLLPASVEMLNKSCALSFGESLKCEILNHSYVVDEKQHKRSRKNEQNSEPQNKFMYDHYSRKTRKYLCGAINRYLQGCIQECKYLMVYLKKIRPRMKKTMNSTDNQGFNTDLNISIPKNSDERGESTGNQIVDSLTDIKFPNVLFLKSLISCLLSQDGSLDRTSVLFSKLNLISMERETGVSTIIVKTLDELELLLHYVSFGFNRSIGNELHGVPENDELYSILRFASEVATLLKATGGDDSMDHSSDQESNTEEYLIGNLKRRKKGSRLRSRNTIIDDWLEGEDGDDVYADLENFLVP